MYNEFIAWKQKESVKLTAPEPGYDATTEVSI